MSRKALVEKNLNRQKLVKQFLQKRCSIKEKLSDPKLTFEEQFKLRLKLASLPRNSSPVRVRNRCQVSGRPRGYYRKLKMSRIALRELASAGYIPGMIKASW